MQTHLTVRAQIQTEIQWVRHICFTVSWICYLYRTFMLGTLWVATSAWPHCELITADVTKKIIGVLKHVTEITGSGAEYRTKQTSRNNLLVICNKPRFDRQTGRSSIFWGLLLFCQRIRFSGCMLSSSSLELKISCWCLLNRDVSISCTNKTDFYLNHFFSLHF